MSTPKKIVKISDTISVGDGQKLLLIAGPCQIESLEHSLKIAEALKQMTASLPISLVFKSSFDKANRTSLHGQRGVGLEEGLKVLEKVRSEIGVSVLTDVHTTEQAKSAGEVVDVLQIPAFLCRQTDLLQAAGATGKTVNVKKGQFLAPEDMTFAAEKISAAGSEKIMLCERGATFGYRDLVVDMRSLVIMRRSGYPVVFDATHSVQSMGGAGGKSGGAREFVFPLLRAAISTGVDGVFIECHDDPARAPSDGATMLELKKLPNILNVISSLHETIRKFQIDND